MAKCIHKLVTISDLDCHVPWLHHWYGNIYNHQSLDQRSKTSTSLADTGSASGGTFQCMQFLLFLSIFSYLFYLGHLICLGL